MLKNLIWSFLIMSQLTHQSWGCDNARLDGVAESYSDRIANLNKPIKKFISRGNILADLTFLRREEEMRPFLMILAKKNSKSR